MDEMTVGGLVAIFTALPGIVFGLAMLLGKWRPASPRNGVDTEAVRLSVARALLAINGAIGLLGLLLIVAPAHEMRPLMPYAIGVVSAVTIISLLFVVQAARAAR